MNNFINLSISERNAIIANTAERMKMSQAIIEKDFWVCWALSYIFNHCKYKDYFCFKGGTCLSKVYHVIDRFSEDIDLILDLSLIDLSMKIAYEERSNRQQDIFNKDVNSKTEDFIYEKLLPLLTKDFSDLLSDSFELYIDDIDKQTLCFRYPQSFEDESILQIIRLEIGVLAESIPYHNKPIKSYISEQYPMIFEKDDISVKAIDVTRTFFEKITILHREAKRVNGNYPIRYSRHYYDVYKLIKCDIGNEALNNLNLLSSVVIFKKKFYPCTWANYDEVLIGQCCLVPKQEAITAFKKDYVIMKGMITSDYPDFNDILIALKGYEELINSTIKSKEKEL